MITLADFKKITAIFALFGLFSTGTAYADQSLIGVSSPSLTRTLDNYDPLKLLTGSSKAAHSNSLSDNSATPLSLPLSLTMGKDAQSGAQRGVSFLYYAPPALVAGKPGDKPTHTLQRSTFGFSNSLGLGQPFQINGLAYFSGGQMQPSGQKSSELISQKLDYAHKSWKFSAQFQDVGKDFAGFDTLKQQSGSLGFLSGATNDQLDQLANMKGQKRLGLSAGFSDQQNHLTLDYLDTADSLAKLHSQHQFIDYGRSFTGGLSLDASHQTDTSSPAAKTSNTTTTNHYLLAFDQGRGMSLKAQLTQTGDTQGRAESTQSFELSRKLKNLSLQASYLKFTPTAGKGEAQTTQSIRWNWQTLKGIGFDGQFIAKENPDGRKAKENQEQIHLNWALRHDLTFEGRWAKGTNSLWKQAGDERELMLQGLIARNLSIQAKLASKTDGASRHNEQAKDVQTKYVLPRFVGMSNAQWMLTLAERITQGQLISSLRSFTFDSEMRKNLVHLEYAGNVVQAGRSRNHVSSRALRITRSDSKSWLRYAFAYKQRHQSIGVELPDIRDYQIQMQLHHLSLEYHYLNEKENSDGTITDLVQTSYKIASPLSRNWDFTAQLNQSNVYSGKSGSHGYLVGVKGAASAHSHLELGYGRQEITSGTDTVHGQIYQCEFLSKTSDDDSINFNGEMTTWDKETSQTPAKIVATVRLDLKKAY